MESLWQVDHTSLLNEVSLRYLWPLIDEIGYFLSQKSTFEGRAHSKLFKYQVVPRDAFFAPLENKQLLVLHCKAGAVPRWFSLCRFITTGRSDAHSNQRSTTRFTINFDVEEFRKHMSGEVNLHHHKYPPINSRIISEVYHFGTHHSRKGHPENIQEWQDAANWPT